ncbi:hypothetical protein HG264_12940 [Pseudomonas sp. gcc21]|uniref:hypothetical protein n=1 Tax=Pseudomonas sp. gcc21 TaxID=2726989 RepID=UPI0014527786|nr:hypothetical protein [Pseudomonas sp. gcc21]QJD59747.1 hypothetical protein HG264_12940 [Pseudomonas sp. gcc21]
MNQHTELNNKPRGQLKLLAIISVVALPIVAAWVMAKFDIGIPDTQKNKSDLVEPVVTAEDWNMQLEPVGYGAPWRLVVTSADECTETCMSLVHEARQINVALGREAGRVTHVLASAQPQPAALSERLQSDFPRLEYSTLSTDAYIRSLNEHPQSWRQGPQLWVIDPLGRIVLHQDPDEPGKQLLDDLKHLLKVSKVG